MSPSDFGELLKPFVFLDLFDHEGPPIDGLLPPHSGIATLTYVAEGEVSYEHDLVLGHYSVHTSKEALRNGEAPILSLAKRLAREGRLD
jgi:redox-sensitive bicupin YhaK (pirin superfamily)